MATDYTDPVWMVLKIEEAFHITIPDHDAERIRTLGQLHAYVLAKLPQSPRSGCLSSATFYRLRRVLQDRFAIPRERIRPATPMEELLPLEGRQESWQQLAEAVKPARLPELQRPEWRTQKLALYELLALFTMILSFMFLSLGGALLAHGFGWRGAMVFALGLLGSLLCICVDMLVKRAHARLTVECALELPRECRTIRETVYTLLQSDPGRIVSESARASDTEIWNIICSIVEPFLNVPAKTLTPERRFY